MPGRPLPGYPTAPQRRRRCEACPPTADGKNCASNPWRRRRGFRRLIAAGGAFEVRASAAVIGGGELPPRPEAARQEAARLRSYIEDLEAVQRHCEQYFPVPDELTPADRIALRMARLLVQGHCVASPFLTRARFTLNGQDSPTLRSLLSGEPHAVRGSIAAFALTLAGRHLELGPVNFYHPHVTVDEEDGRRALAALEAGRGEGCEATV
ncbi:hypothetical protein ACPCK2_33135, partial [Streptomyces pseudogriseolus]|uniref:hypothetical protein n=1 Tax=Streptomyces pseudogriseolus TaxID=36817 RepID=UPI003FA205F1